MDNTFAVELHTRAGNLPDAWRSSAADLLAAAKVLFDYRRQAEAHQQRSLDAWRVTPSELMLRGMALECLLKAIWVKRGNKLVEHGKYIPVPNAGAHDLVQLANVLELGISDFEKDLLRRLTHFIEYGGRFPVPKNAVKLQMVASPLGGRGLSTIWATPGDYILFDALFERLDSLLDEDSA